MLLNPSVEVRAANGVSQVTPETRLFNDCRVVVLAEPITSATVAPLCAQMAALDRVSHDPIHLIINSPGGSVHDGLALIDCIESMKSPVHTVGTGLVASMAAHILAAGENGHRVVTPNAQLMVHQPATVGVGGQVSEVAIALKSMVRLKDLLNGLLANATGKTREQIEQITERDTWLTPEQAVELGIADEISHLDFND